MTDYDNTDRGALFRNERKESDSHPDHTGTLNVGGRDYWLSAWVKTTRDGRKFFSLSIKPKDGEARTDNKRSGDRPAPLDDDIPF